jgi:hypothetical protein
MIPRYEKDAQGMKKMLKVWKIFTKVHFHTLRYEIGVFLKNSGFSYFYGSISYLFGYEKNRCFFLMWLPPCKTTEDAIKIFRLLRAGCHMRGLEWWLNDALDEFPSVDAREVAASALNKAKWIDQHMEQVLDTALAPQGGIRLDMNDAEEAIMAIPYTG